MNLRKIMAMAISCVFAISVLAACSPAASEHVHTPTGEWFGDDENHWQVCECGETMNSAPHILEDDICTMCDRTVLVYDDGSKEVITYNEHGDCVFSEYYNADGVLENEDRYEYTYDDQGNKLSEKVYYGGILSYETTYAPGEDGEFYAVEDKFYYEDGIISGSVYDGEYIIRSYSCAADGTEEFAYEYEYSDDHSWMSESEYQYGELTSQREYSVDSDGLQTMLKEIIYNEDGSSVGMEYDLYGNEIIEVHTDAEGKVELEIIFEHSYDEAGNRTSTKTYENGELRQEMEYIFGEDEDGSWSMSGKITDYNEDGTVTVSDSDPEGAWNSEITYDEDGKVIKEVRYENQLDDNGEVIGVKGYEDGRLFEESQPILDENGEPAGLRFIYYDKDGSKTVIEYDDTFTQVAEIKYDSDGNIVE